MAMTKCKPTVDMDQALELLASARRRQVLWYLLREADSPVYRSEIATELDISEPQDPRTLELVLAHTDLPRLADAGAIEYDHRSGTVRLSEGAEALEPLLQACFEWEARPD